MSPLLQCQLASVIHHVIVLTKLVDPSWLVVKLFIDRSTTPSVIPKKKRKHESDPHPPSRLGGETNLTAPLALKLGLGLRLTTLASATGLGRNQKSALAPDMDKVGSTSPHR